MAKSVSGAVNKERIQSNVLARILYWILGCLRSFLYTRTTAVLDSSCGSCGHDNCECDGNNMTVDSTVATCVCEHDVGKHGLTMINEISGELVTAGCFEKDCPCLKFVFKVGTYGVDIRGVPVKGTPTKIERTPSPFRSRFRKD